ncbi:hypothetical protein chiPu_0030016, partial [Chiloscyllium punctatum]|nr:hypothetical protein [Chiloscyllium punctatum]
RPLADLPFAQGVQTERPARRPDRRADAGRDRDPGTDGDCAARRVLAADRLLRLHGGLARLCDVRRQPLPVLRRRLHDHADLRRRTGADGDSRFARLSGVRDGAGAAGRRDHDRRQPVQARLDCQSALDAGDGRLPRRHIRPHPGLATARRARPDHAGRADALQARSARREDRPDQCLHAGDRARRASAGRRIGEDQRADSGCADRACRRHHRCRRRPSRKQGRQGGRHRAGHAAQAVISGHRTGAMDQAAVARDPDRRRRDGA